MGDYSGMADRYDLIMTSGYYDYDRVAGALATLSGAASVLELGSGTGLILEQLARRRPDLALAGVDLTESMLDVARARLDNRPDIALYRQDVSQLDLNDKFDVAYSYGGVWYFAGEYSDTDDSGGSLQLVSHLRDPAQNRSGLRRLAGLLPPGGRLLLGIQGAHHDYARPISNGMLYSQQITGIVDGFHKRYRLTDGDTVVMEESLDYRTYSFQAALDLLASCGFDALGPVGDGAPLFLAFGKHD
ncbi:MAG: class I SAM-dependent methyltransferase [Nocardioides sp.]